LLLDSAVSSFWCLIAKICTRYRLYGQIYMHVSSHCQCFSRRKILRDIQSHLKGELTRESILTNFSRSGNT